MAFVAFAVETAAVWFLGYRLPLNMAAKQYTKKGSVPLWPFWVCFAISFLAMGVMSILFMPSYSARGVDTGIANGLYRLAWLFVFVFPIRAAKNRDSVCQQQESESNS